MVSNALGLSSTSGPHSPLQCSPRTKPLRACNKIAIQALTGENNSLNRSWPYRGQDDSTATYNSQNTGEKHSPVIMANNRPRATLSPQHTIPTAVAGKLTQTRKWEKNNSQTMHDGKRRSKPKLWMELRSLLNNRVAKLLHRSDDGGERHKNLCESEDEPNHRLTIPWERKNQLQARNPWGRG